MNLLTRLLLATCLALPLAASTASACPLCKEAIPEANGGAESDHDPERLARAYNYSIFGVLGVMFSLLGGVGFVIYRSQRQIQ